MTRTASASGRACEELVGGALPHLAARWPGQPLSAGITTRALNFGRHTEAPAREVAAAHADLRDWARDRFDGIVGGLQVHGARLLRADGIVVPRLEARAGPFTLRVAGTDGFVTSTAGLLLTVGVADCVPVVVYAPSVPAVALLHAGWRGVAGGILARALEAIGQAYGVPPEECVAWWGPAIGVECYPVGAEVVESIRATSAGPDAAGWTRREGDRVHVDLRAALTRQALAAGIPTESITASPRCTACDAALFHSYRREQGGGGRMLAFAGLVSPES